MYGTEYYTKVIMTFLGAIIDIGGVSNEVLLGGVEGVVVESRWTG